MSLVSKAFSDIITFSRSSNATRIGPDGLVQYAPHNLILQSQTFDNASWSKSQSSVTANSLAAPDGTITADTLIENTSLDYHQLYQTVSVTSGLSYTFSVYAKSKERTAISIWNQATGTVYAIFNLANGSVSQGGGTSTNQITSIGNGWYRCSVSVSATASGTGFFNIQLYNGATSYTGDGTSGIYIWGAQLSVGTRALDYTPTTSAAVYGPRFDYDPVTLAAKGLLIEESRSNLVTYSEQFNNAAWTVSGNEISITSDAVSAPNGTVTADYCIPSTTNSFHRLNQSISVSTSGLTVTYSLYVKPNGYNYIALRESSSVGAAAVFNLNGNGSVAGYNFNPTYVSGAEITSVGNGWFRISAQFFAVPVQSFGIYVLSNWTSGDPQSATFSGNGTSGVYVWGAQAESGAFSTSYIPTLASSVTRSADVASVNTLSPWYSSTEGTLFAESVSYSNEPRPASLSNSGSSDTIGLGAVTPNNGRLYIYRSGVEQANLSVAFSVATLKEAAVYKANDAQYCANGTLSSQDTSVTLPTLNKMDIGYFTIAGAYHNGWIRRIAYYSRRLSNAELQALTA